MKIFFRRPSRPASRPRPGPSTSSTPGSPTGSDAERQVQLGFQVLAVMNDWIKTADVKAASVLAASGVAAGVLFNLAHDSVTVPATPGKPAAVTNLSVSSAVCTAACAALLLFAAACAAAALLPRLHAPGSWRARPHFPSRQPNPLYFGHVKAYYGDPAGGQQYATDVLALFTDSAHMAATVANQVHTNALIAHRKHRWMHRALLILMLGLGMLAASAVLRFLA